MNLRLCLLFCLLACGDKSELTDDTTPADTDTDTDTDADTDADTDTDANTDDTNVPGDRTCDNATGLTPTELEFRTLYPQKLCFAYSFCNADIDCDPGPLPAGDCIYDDVDACACLDADFRCNTEFGAGFEYVEFPPMCNSAFRCN